MVSEIFHLNLIGIEGIYSGDVEELSHSLTYMPELFWPKDDTCYISKG